MNDLKTGDIVSLNHSEFSSGFIFGVRDNGIQIFLMSSKKTVSSPSIRIRSKDVSGGKLTKDQYILTDQILLMGDQNISNKIGRLSVRKIDEILRGLARDIASKHYYAIHNKREFFKPGKTLIPYAGRVYNASEIKSLVDCSLDFWLTAGRFSKKFEEGFKKFLGVKQCIPTNSGSSANLLAVSALTSPKLGDSRLKAGDEVITTACAFPTTVNPIVQNNLVPVFLDVDVGTYNIQAEKIEDSLSEKTKAIFLAHTLGNPFNVDKVMQIANKHNLWVLEDNCDALGSKYDGRYTGTFGQISTFSFYPSHHITMGEGGALATDDEKLARIIKSFRDWGRDCWCEPGCDNTCGKRFHYQLGTLPQGYDHKYIYSHLGYNLKITDMQAAVGVEQLKKLPAFIKSRRKNFRTLYNVLKKHEEHFILPQAEVKAEPSWFGFPITVKKDAGFTRNDIVEHLEENKIATRMLFAGNITRHPSFKHVRFRLAADLRNTDFIMKNTFWLGVYPGITPKKSDFILKCIDLFLSENG
ncbi:MAG: lipopolysaccharide biosynthesis protein RfbH [Methanobacteriota archaeon]